MKKYEDLVEYTRFDIKEGVTREDILKKMEEDDSQLLKWILKVFDARNKKYKSKFEIEFREPDHFYLIDVINIEAFQEEIPVIAKDHIEKLLNENSYDLIYWQAEKLKYTSEIVDRGIVRKQ